MTSKGGFVNKKLCLLDLKPLELNEFLVCLLSFGSRASVHISKYYFDLY
jgi:hypothetical protein